MKFSNFLSKLGHILIVVFEFVVLVLPFPVGIIAVIIFDGFTNPFIPLILWVFPLALNWFLGTACRATFYNTGYVREGRTVLDIVRDERYYKRAIYVNFITMSLFILWTIYFIAVGYFPIIISPILFIDWWGLVSIIGAIIGAVLYFLLAMSAIEKSGIKNKNKMDKNEFAEHFKNQEPIKKEKVVITKFNFENEQEMFEVYNAYKQAKNKAIHLKNQEKYLDEYNKVCLERDERFEELAKHVFNKFNAIKPTLINKKTNEKVKWVDLFANNFESLTKKQKDYLIRLLDAQPYKFENDKYYN